MRRIALLAGVALVVIAFAAATQVADTRQGLIAEVVTLLTSLAGVGLLIYGLTYGRGPQQTLQASHQTGLTRSPRPKETRDLLLGAGGVLVAVILVGGLGYSGGALWASLGLALLLPMIAGAVYLCIRFLRANP